MKLTHLLLVIIIALGAGYAGAKLAPASTTTAEKKETAYERVMRTRTIRCGYVPYEPFVRIDPNTKAFSGLAVDIMNEMGRLLSLKIEWTEEVGWATTIEGLNRGRYDAVCVGFWRIPTEGQYAFYSIPFAYSRMVAISRYDDNRFDNNYTAINVPSVRIVAADGMETINVAKHRFPQAQLITLPNMTDQGTVFANVIAGKADLYFEDASTVYKFMEQNPGKVKIVQGVPLQVYQNTLGLPQDEKLKSLIDTALYQMLEGGTIDELLGKYDNKGSLLRIAKGYAAP